MRRRSINPGELKPHKNPIPMACRVDNILMTSAIQGHDPRTGEFPIDKIQQIKLAFDALNTILLEAKATPEDIVKIDLFFEDKNDRALVNPFWLKMFPDPKSRPARHAQVASLTAGCCLQISATAVLKTSSR
ncbi:MAG: RidA family protein [Paracoccaceae bacterium]